MNPKAFTKNDTLDDIFNKNYIGLWNEFSETRKTSVIVPFFMAYALIEVSAKLGHPNKNIGSKERFVWWVENFLNKNAVNQYDVMDLYGARCGLLHEYGASSDLSRAEKCREVMWAAGNSTRNLHGKTHPTKDGYVMWHREIFFEDLSEAILRFLEVIRDNTTLRKQVSERVPYLFGFTEINKKPQ